MISFWNKVRVSNEEDCWEWTASRTRNGYGRLSFEGRFFVAHRFLWMNYAEVTESEIRDLDICHHCDNRACVNPDHLFAASRSANMIDASHKKKLWNQNRTPPPFGNSKINSQKTHCKFGHPLSGVNLRIEGTKKRQRRCLTCSRLKQLLFQRERRRKAHG